MSKSERVTASEGLAILRLVNECRELGADAAAWQSHLVTGLLRFTGGVLGAVGPGPSHRTGSFKGFDGWADRHIDGGWPSAAMRARWVKWASEPANLAAHPAVSEFVARPEANLTLIRRELVDDRAWDLSPFVNDVLRADGFDEGLAARVEVPVVGIGYTITIMRATREAPFRPQIGSVVSQVQAELAPHLGRALLLTTQPNLHGLSVRLRQVLDGLLNGDSEKQVARHLGLARSTLHDHVKRLYRHFGVTSRAELLAYFLRRYRSGPQ